MGSLAEVYLATAPDGRPYVVKRLREDMRNDAARALMLIEEGELLMRLVHAGLVHCEAVSREPPAQVLTHVDGVPLHAALTMMGEQGQRFEPARAVDLVRMLATTLAYLHAQQVCHLDIGPDNVLVARDGRVVLTDLARGQWPGRRTRIDYEPIPHKLGYCAPELWKGEPLSAATDIYQLGCLLWELLAG